jgi:hypothetical protein
MAVKLKKKMKATVAFSEINLNIVTRYNEEALVIFVIEGKKEQGYL